MLAPASQSDVMATALRHSASLPLQPASRPSCPFSPQPAQKLPKGKAIVPGCGRGYAPVAFANAGYEATGIDLSSTATQKAKEYVATLKDESRKELLQVTPPEGSLHLKTANFFEIEDSFDVRHGAVVPCPNRRHMRTGSAAQRAARHVSLAAPREKIRMPVTPVACSAAGCLRLHVSVRAGALGAGAVGCAVRQDCQERRAAHHRCLSH